MINKFTAQEIFQVAEGDKRVKSDAIDSVKIPLFNQTPSVGVKIKALIDKIVAWVKTKFTTADTKAFLTALGESIKANENQISALENGDDALVITFNVPKTSERFDRLFITMTIEKNADGFQLKHNDKVVAEDLEKAELLGVKDDMDMMPKSAIKEIRELVNEVKAADTKNKVALTTAKTGFKNDLEYIISSQATKLQAKYDFTPEETQNMTNGLRALSDCEYSFSNTSVVKDKDGKKHAPGKIKFDSSKVTFAGGEVTLKDEVQIKKMCGSLLEKELPLQSKALAEILAIVSPETRQILQDTMEEVVLENFNARLLEASDVNLIRLVEDVEIRSFPTSKTILAEDCENLTVDGKKNLYVNNIKVPLQQAIDNGEIDGIESGTAVSFVLIKKNPALANKMLEIFGAIKIDNEYGNDYSMQDMLEAIDVILPVANVEEIVASSKELGDLGIDMRSASRGEMRNINLLNAWNKYKEAHPDSNLWQFLSSAPANRDIEAVKLLPAVTGGVKYLFTASSVMHKAVVDFLGQEKQTRLEGIFLEKICEQAIKEHNHKIGA